MTTTSKILSTAVVGTAIAAVLLVGGTAFAHGKDGKDNDNKREWNKSALALNGDLKLKLGNHATTTKPVLFTGTGQPVVGGTVTAVNGNILTVVTATGVMYSVNATTSTVVQGKATTTPSSVAVGSKVIVQGSVNGSNVTATSVIASQATTTNNGNGMKYGWGFGHIKLFLHNLFGFF